jgi:F0F1-type ATP synthase membrane subunit c/vacuolar-type H+-ATPase subunit K
MRSSFCGRNDVVRKFVGLTVLVVVGKMVFVKASKVMALGFVFLPLTGCAVATGLVFAALIRGVSYATDLEETMFNYTALGFAFIESFSFLLFFIAGLIMVL